MKSGERDVNVSNTESVEQTRTVNRRLGFGYLTSRVHGLNQPYG